jgi:hypothetical protein
MINLKRAKRVAWYAPNSNRIRVVNRVRPDESFADEDGGLSCTEEELCKLGTALRVIEEFPPPPIKKQLDGATIIRYGSSQSESRVAVRQGSSDWVGYTFRNVWDTDWLAYLIEESGGHMEVLVEKEEG